MTKIAVIGAGNVGGGLGTTDQVVTPGIMRAIENLINTFRDAVGPDIDICLDLNFNFKTEGFLRMAKAMEPFDIFWVEIDTRDPQALRYIRSRTTIPVASCVCSSVRNWPS